MQKGRSAVTNNLSEKILYILTKPDLGGVQNYLLEITKGLPENITPYYIMSSEGYLSDELKALGIKDEQIFFVPMTNSIVDIKTHIKSNLETLKIIKQVKPNKIHCNSTTGGIIGRICGALTNTPVIFTAHGWAFTNGICLWKRVFYKVLETFLAIFTKKIICVSEFDRQIGIKTMPFFRDKLVTIHNGISDISEEHKKIEFSKDELKLVMISRFCKQKDPYTLITCVCGLNKEGYNIKLDLYGYGEELEQVKETIFNTNCKNIQYKGEVSDVTPILKNYDIYSLISNWEGLPIGIIEAMRAGLPILVSNVGGNSECIKDNGYLVKRQDIQDCMMQIKKLWESRENLLQLGQNSKKFYEEEFINKKMTEATYNLYKECLK